MHARGNNSGPIWSTHMQPHGEQAFYAGDNGEVGMLHIARGDRYVSADAHHCLAGLPVTQVPRGLISHPNCSTTAFDCSWTECHISSCIELCRGIPKYVG